MTAGPAVTAKAAWYSKISEIHFGNDELSIRDGNRRTTETIRVQDIRLVRTEAGPFHTGLRITFKSGWTENLGGFHKDECQRVRRAIEARLAEIRIEESREAARQAVLTTIRKIEKEKKADLQADQRAKQIRPQINTLVERVDKLLSTGRFTRRSECRDLVHEIQELIGQINDRLKSKFDRKTVAALDNLRKLATEASVENARQESNHKFVTNATATVREKTKDISRHPLTDEQAIAVATDEDVSLVLAGAGTGKTAVIAGKIGHLVRNRDAAPESILALAFNRKAALEIGERLPEDLKEAQVSTFHAFARQVVASQGTAPTISTLAEDDFAYHKAIDAILNRMTKDPQKAKLIIQMVSGFSAEYRAPFDFSTPYEYEQYVRDAQLRTLNGELVKSFEELTVANFLAAQGVRYTYEKPYQFLTATQEFRQYLPDFHLPDYDIYIEHFALNEQGQAPPGWTRYVEDARWKRATHAQYGTKLIESYSWQFRSGILESTLADKLERSGVEFNPVPPEELVNRLSNERISRLSGLLGTFLTHAKSSDLGHEEITAEANDQKDKDRTECFLQIFADVRQGYEEMLAAEDAVDFHDLINKAAAIINAGQWDNPFEYVLVDEFQDISNGRMSLAKALKKPGMAYFLVGDDWQSIYKFAGSYVGLIHQTEDHLGFTDRKALTTTFRFGDGILRPPTTFVQQNPEQTKRQVVAHHQDGDQGITVIPADLPETGLHEALREIEEFRAKSEESVMVLGRYRSSRRILDETRGQFKNIQFNTVHSTKGLEADYVVVLDLKDDRYGFPCMVEDDPLLTIVMPPTHGDPFPFAEERRLFYVALTRARRAVYLITDPVRPSPFVRELIKICPTVKVKAGLRPQCPACGRGSLIPSQSGDNLRCSNFPRCRHLSPRCSGCGRGYVHLSEDQSAAECSNPACGSPPRICPRCREGILVLRSGQSWFWGCTGYVATPSCTYTENAPDQVGSDRAPATRGRRMSR